MTATPRIYRRAEWAVLTVGILFRLYLAFVNREANDDHLTVIRMIARDHRFELAPQSPGPRPVAAAHLEDVAKAGGGDDAGFRTLALEQGVGGHGRAVDHCSGGSREPGDGGNDPAALVVRRARHLADGEVKRLERRRAT